MKRFREDRYISDEGVGSGEGTQAMRTQDDAGAQTHVNSKSLQRRSPLSPCT